MKAHPQSMNLIYNVGYTLSRWLATLLLSYRTHGAEKIPSEGGVILAANHTSFFDPPLVGIASQRAMWYLARKTLLEWPLLGPIFPSLNVIPVDRDGNDRTALKAIIRLLQAGEGVVLFPEGTRSPDGHLQRGKPGIGMIIAKSQVPVVPVRVFGAYEAYPKGAKRLQPTQVHVCFGEPMSFPTEHAEMDAREWYQELSNQVMSAIAAIPDPRRMDLGGGR
jgi:1-acyl-sn-glycerol-3-phosphate acyltransferase